ncbi:MAG: hypothetical protein ACYTGV_04715 [Planctomycetota bacterium]|jgi:hypothetical protein
MQRASLVLVATCCVTLPAISGGDIASRVGSLIERWRDGDAAARVGVVAETAELGDEAIDELYRRLAYATRDFPARDPGVVMSMGTGGTLSDRAVSMEIRFGKLKKELASEPKLLGEPPEAESISAPRLTMYDGQRSNISVLSQKSYVRTYEGEDPIAGTVRDGLVLDLRPIVSRDGRFITFEMRCVQAELADPIGTLKTPAGPIGVPVVLKRETAFTVTVPDGSESHLALPGKTPLLISIRADLVELEGLGDEPIETDD